MSSKRIKQVMGGAAKLRKKKRQEELTKSTLIRMYDHINTHQKFRTGKGFTWKPARIVVHLPLPKHINEERVLVEISIDKGVDGFHPLNFGKLAMKGKEPLFQPCTPKGYLELLSRSGVSVKGKKADVVGRSNIVGLPVSLLLLKADATVTVVHSRTTDAERIIREADIVIAAAG